MPHCGACRSQLECLTSAGPDSLLDFRKNPFHFGPVQIPALRITIKMSSTVLNDLATPDHAIADFCIIPIGTGSASVLAEVADVQRLIQKSGLKYTMHSAGTTIGKLRIIMVTFISP